MVNFETRSHLRITRVGEFCNAPVLPVCREGVLMIANWITLSRFPLLLIHAGILYYGSPQVRLFGVLLLFTGLMLDTVDGVVARKLRQTSLFGSVLDIAADRTYELVLWACFADLGLISIVIPVVVIARTTLTDAFRSIGVAQGIPPFEQEKSKLGRFLVGSPITRTGYAVSKVVTFCGLALTQAAIGMGPGTALGDRAEAMLRIFQTTAWVALVFCICRGLPVIVSTLKRYWAIPHSREQRTEN